MLWVCVPIVAGGDLDEGGDVAVQALLPHGVVECCDEDLVDAVDGGGREVLSEAGADGAALGLFAAALFALGAALAGGLQSGDEAAYVGDAELPRSMRRSVRYHAAGRAQTSGLSSGALVTTP